MLRPLLAAALLLVTAPAASAFSIGFDWSGLKSCTSGKPNKVPSPAFTLKDLPKGTQSVTFKLTDLDVRQFRHGGGTVNVSTSGTLPRGAFTYLSPCPPNGTHRYEWSATAKSAPGGKGKTLGKTKAMRPYP